MTVLVFNKENTDGAVMYCNAIGTVRRDYSLSQNLAGVPKDESCAFSFVSRYYNYEDGGLRWRDGPVTILVTFSFPSVEKTKAGKKAHVTEKVWVRDGTSGLVLYADARHMWTD